MLCGVSIKKIFLCFAFCTFFDMILSFSVMASDSVFPYETDAEIQNITNEQYNEVKTKIEEYYLGAMDDVSSGVSNKYLKGMTFGERLYSLVFQAYDAVYKSAIYLGGLSVLIGIFVCLITSKNKGLFKWSLTRLVFGLPLLLTIIIFGVGAFR